MNSLKKIVSLLLVLATFLSMLPLSASAADEDLTEYALISVENTYAADSQTIDVDVTISGNPGILGATLTFSYSDKLTLIGAVNGEAFSALPITFPGEFTSPCNFMWSSEEILPEEVADGVILTLTFEVSEDAVKGEKLAVNASYVHGDIIDNDLEPVNVLIANGGVDIIDFIPGDLDDDGTVASSKDVVLAARYVAGGYDVTIIEAAADVNADCRINPTDVILMKRYKAGGYGVELKPSLEWCTHELTATAAKAATCTEDGNIAYWHCTKCDKYFRNESAVSAISKDATIITKLDHNEVIIPAIDATEDQNGWTEGVRCDRCGKTIVEPEPIEIDEYIIEYKINPTNDAYLAKEGNLPVLPEKNPTRYKEGTGTIPLLDIEENIPVGYSFAGWYDVYNNPVKEISKDSKSNITVYAHWEKENYDVTFVSPLVPKETVSRTVDKITPLEKQELPGYTFIGWSDENGNMLSNYMVEPGTTDITLYANWTSNRNLTRPVEKLGTPIIHFDENGGQILFLYEIGTVENIPLADLGYYDHTIAPTDINWTTRKAITIDEGAAQEISEAISKATTNTSAWTLSQEWNQTTSISEEHLHELNMEESEDWEEAFSESDTFNISTSEGGRTETVVSGGVSAKVGSKVSHEASIGFPLDIFDVGAKVNQEFSAELGVNASSSKTDEKTWNTNTGYSASQESSMKHTLSSKLAEKISNSVSYNVSNSKTESTSNSYSTASTSTNSREYASTFTYTTIQYDEQEYSKTLKDAPAGHYRLVAAGTAHVFAVVTYDIANQAYGVYTYSIMEDEVRPFLDYSKDTASFNDNENGVLNFEVPYYVNNYVDSIIGASDGLIVNENGVIVEYEGSDELVIIPQYMPIDNGDGTASVVKVVGFEGSTKVFQGKNIKAVQLNSFIKEIPANAFKGCEQLKAVYAPSITKIGANAFDGCTSLENFTVTNKVTELGTQAFNGVKNVTVNAKNSAIAKAAISCGAKSLTLAMADCEDTLSNTKLEIASTTEYFAFLGATKTYSGVTIASNAKTTVINGANFINNKGTVLKLASDNVTLNRVTVETSGWAMVLEPTSKKTDLQIQGEVNLNTSGTSAVLAYDMTVSKVAGTNAASYLNVQGNVWICGNITDSKSYLTIDGNLTENISQDEYDKLLKGSLDWVLASEVPAGAQIVSQKWTYDLKTDITSDKSSVDGYTLYDTVKSYGEYGAWSSWSKTSASASETRQVEQKTVTDQAAYTEYRYWRYRQEGSNWVHWCEKLGKSYHGGTWYKDWSDWSTTRKPVLESPCGKCSCCGTATSYGTTNSTYYWEETRTVAAVTHQEYRFRDRAIIYTYYHTKTETLESETEITAGNNISNVQKWVQYIIE